MRILLWVAALSVCAGCCGVSEEARDLAWSIAQYQRVQAKDMRKLTKDEAILITTNALAVSTTILVEILGEPETKPVLPGIEVAP